MQLGNFKRLYFTILSNFTARRTLLYRMETRRVEEPCLAIGVIADVQYADADDGYNFSKTNRRYYRTALKMLDKAVTFWNKEAQKKPQFVLQLGDVIDGLNKRQNTSESGLADVMNSLSNFEGCVYHIWGNHEYYNFSREYLLKSSLYSGNTAYSTPVPGKVYYTCEPHPNLRVIALDCYEISMLASPPDSEQFKMAGEYMANNLNTDKNSGEGLVGDSRRFVRFNGATSEAQIDWMRRNLQEAEKLRQNVIIMDCYIEYPWMVIVVYMLMLQMFPACAGTPLTSCTRFTSTVTVCYATSPVMITVVEWPLTRKTSYIWHYQEYWRTTGIRISVRCTCMQTGWSWWAMGGSGM